MKRDYTFVRRGDTLPKNKHGDKPRYFPERHLVDPDLHPRPTQLVVGSRSVKAKGEHGGHYVQSSYLMADTDCGGRKGAHKSVLRVHRETIKDPETGKRVMTGSLRNGVHHSKALGSKRKKQPKATVFDRTLRVEPDQFTAHGIEPKGRDWVSETYKK